MTDSAQAANRFVQHFSALTTRLAALNIVVSSLHCDWSSFGSWALEAQKGAAADAYGKALLAREWDTSGPEVFRAVWDGREKFLTIETAPTEALTSPGPWTRQFEQTFEHSDHAVTFIEERLRRWASATR